MCRTRFVVRLLALAGSAGLFIAGQGHISAPPKSSSADGLNLRSGNAHPAIPLSHPRTILAQAAPPGSGAASTEFRVARRAAGGSLPLAFEPNVGQADSKIQFVGRGAGTTILLTRSEITVRAGASGALGIHFEGARRISASLVGNPGARHSITWRGRLPLRGETNYLLGNDRRKWHTGVPHFSRVEAGSVMPGVSVAVYGGEQGVEYDLQLAPGTDVSTLRVALKGAHEVRLDPAGNLVMHVGNDELTMRKPVVYEEASFFQNPHRRKSDRASGAGRRGTRKKPRKKRRRHTIRKPVKAAYILEQDGSIGFRVGPHDPRSVLVIDPTLSVAYATFLGGSGADVAQSIALDSAGKIYVGGTTTSSTTFPEGSGNRLGPVDGPSEFFIAKIDPTVTGPNSLVYLTFLGGSGNQAGGVIAVDGSGNVAITGTTTATDFPVTDTTQPTNGLTSGYGNDVIVSEIDPTGTKLVFSTLFGGSGVESASAPGGIALDSSGRVYIASDTTTTPVDTNTPDLPVTNGAFQTVWDDQQGDGFLAIFQPPPQAGGAATLDYCSYLGTNSVGSPGVGGVAVDQVGNAYIVGFTDNSVSGFPYKNAFQSEYGGGTADAFLMKIAPAGAGSQDLVYATLLGGSGEDEALGVALDSSNPPNAYVTGLTESPDFPVGSATAGFQKTLHVNATSNAFLAVVAQGSGTGITSLSYSTYLGGSATDAGEGIAVSAPNAVYITGNTTSLDFPWRDNLQPFNGAGDAFVAKLDPTSAGAASLIYATPLGGTSPPGGSASASGNAVAADGNGHAYVAGITTSGDFPAAVTTSGGANGFQQNCASCSSLSPHSDAFIAEIAEAPGQSPSVLFSLPHLNFPAGSTAPQFVGVLNGGEAGLTISSVSVIGPNAADFSISGQAACVGPTIAPGSIAQCSFEVGFTPSMVGPETAVVSVTDNAPGSPQVLELTGAGGNGPLAAVSPAVLNFGSQPENTATSNPGVVYLQNIGNQPLTLSSFSVGGEDAAQFQLNAKGANGFAVCQVQASVSPGGGCAVQIAFAPTGQGSFQAELDFFDNSGNTTNAEQAVPLTGIGVAPAPVASLAPPSLSFGSVTVGASSGSQSTTLTDTGSTALSLSSVVLTGTNAADFQIVMSGTSCPIGGGSVLAGANCSVAVQFAPQSAGSKNASLSFSDNAAGSPQQVSLSGTGVVAPTVTLSPSSLTFSAQSDGTSSAPQTVTVSNTGNASAGIGPVTVTGADAADFVPSNSCAPSLAAGKNCQISVTFAPPAGSPVGPLSATLNVGGATPSTVALAGIAAQSSVSVPTGLNFGSQLAGVAGTPQPIVVTNNSAGPYAGPLTVFSVSVGETGAISADFSVTADSCTGTNTPPSGTCSIQVAFKPASPCPTITGTRNGTLTINDNAPGSPHSVPLGGTAVDFCANTAPGQGIGAPISPGQSEAFNLEIQSSDTASGSAQLACSVPADMLGGCSISTSPATNPPVVQVTSPSPGQFLLTVTSTAPGASIGGGANSQSRRHQWLMSRMQLIAMTFVVWLILWRWTQTSSLSGGCRTKSATLAQAAVVGLAMALSMAACGGGGASTSDPAPGSPPATYGVVVTATINVAGQGTITRTFTQNVTIQSSQ